MRTPTVAGRPITTERFDQGGRDLLGTAEPDGTFRCPFYKAQARATLDD